MVAEVGRWEKRLLRLLKSPEALPVLTRALGYAMMEVYSGTPSSPCCIAIRHPTESGALFPDSPISSHGCQASNSTCMS